MLPLGFARCRPLRAALALLLASLPAAHAILINGEGPTNVTGIYDRFTVGSYPSAPVDNPSFIGAALDLSGIGWLAGNAAQSVSLISPHYIVAARHNMPDAGTVLRFFGSDHQLYTATLASTQALTYTGTGGSQVSDLAVGRLTLAMPAAVTPLPIFYLGETTISDPASFDKYAGVALFNYGHTARMGTNSIDEFSEFTLYGGAPRDIGIFYDHGPGPGETLLESGDSGSPTLAYLEGAYGLIGTHSGVDTPNGFSADAFVAYTPYIDQLGSILAADGEVLTFAAVPEPSTLVFGLAATVLAVTRRNRRRVAPPRCG